MENVDTRVWDMNMLNTILVSLLQAVEDQGVRGQERPRRHHHPVLRRLRAHPPRDGLRRREEGALRRAQGPEVRDRNGWLICIPFLNMESNNMLEKLHALAVGCAWS